MKSPFAFFRKHARVLTVILTGLAMFAFVIMDQIRNTPELFPVTMGVLGGGLLLWVLGRRSGHAIEFAVVGAILGGVVSYNSISGLGPGAVVETSEGRISQRELNNLVNRRQLANRFIADAYYRSNSDQQFARRPPQFGFGDTTTPEGLEEDVVLGYLLRHEAALMGVSISDETVNDYINQATNNKLSSKVFHEILTDTGLGRSKLFDVIRDQLTASTALQNLIPRNLPTPEEYWRLYRQMNVTQRLEVAAVPVAVFASEVAEPEKAELEAYFEKHKMVFANRTGPGDPGFYQPPRVRLAYVEADYETFENKVGDVSDADVEKFYEANKELYRNRRIPDDPLTNDETIPLDPQFVPEEGAEPGEAAPADDAEAGSADSDKPAEAEGSSDDAGETDRSESPAEASLQKETLRDATDWETGTGFFRNVIALRTANGDFAGTTASDEAQLFQLVSAESVLNESDEEPSPVAAGEDLTGEPSSAADEPTEAGVSTEATDAAETTAETATESTAPDAEDGDAEESEEWESLPEFRPLDEELRGEIRDQLLRERAFQAMEQGIAAAEEVMFSMGVDYAGASDDQKKSLPQQFDAKLNAYAEEHSLRYVATDWLSPEALADTEQHPIGGATEPGTDSSAFGAAATTVREKLFAMSADESPKLYSVDVVESRLISSRYAYWTIDHAAQRVPAFTDEGIEAEVLAAWKNENARPLARKRADELSEIVRGSDKEMPESLAEMTVNGKDAGEQVTIRQTESFSWLRQSSAPQTNPFNRPPPQLSAISAIDMPSPDFMRVVFDQLGNGEVGVAGNLDKSIYYVVKVKERVPATPSDEEAFRQAFLRNRELFIPFGFSAYGYLITQAQQAANHNWSRRLLEKYAVTWAEPVAQTEP
jgi:hypothetical protein